MSLSTAPDYPRAHGTMSLSTAPAHKRKASSKSAPMLKSKSESNAAPTHKSKSKSISALPPQTLARLTPSTESSLTRSRSVRSCKSRSAGSPAMLSPSRLPSTDSVSYFPPFESMGSHTESDPEDDPQPSHVSHVKGRSLSSLAGLVSWSLNLASSSSTPARQLRDKDPLRSSPDGEVVDRLAKRFTPARRRVLEPRPVNADMLDMQSESRKEGAQKRRMGSEAEVENIIARDRRDLTKEDDEEGLVEVERLLSDSPTRAPRRKSRPTLTVPLPSFPQWRFPLPSPPVTSLSPDIPLEAFRTHISNPLSRETSPQLEEELDEVDDGLSPSPTSCASFDRPSTPRDDAQDDIHGGDDIGGLNGLGDGGGDGGCGGGGGGGGDGDDGDGSRGRGGGADTGDNKLERMESHLSSDSRETIRVTDPEKRAVTDGDRTPRVGKGWRASAVRQVSEVRI